MIKRILFVLPLLVVPFGAFALDLYAGPTAYYASVIQPKGVASLPGSGLSVSDLAFGGDARLYAGPLWGGLVGVYLPGDGTVPHRIQFLTDVGLGLKLAILRAGIGIGPDFGLQFGGGTKQFTEAGANLRITGDVMLGGFSLGLSWVSRVQLTQQSLVNAFSNPYGYLGVSLLFKM